MQNPAFLFRERQGFLLTLKKHQQTNRLGHIEIL